MDKDKIYQIISNVFGVDKDEIQLESDFYDDFNSDRTELVELKLQIEDLINTQIEDDDFFEIKNVEDLLNLIEEYTDEFID
jgi:acyl carrier protein